MVLCALLSLFIALVIGSPASWNECNPVTGHGVVVIPDEKCESFVFYHLAEIQCFHYHQVMFGGMLGDSSSSSKLCQKAGDETLITGVVEARLPDLAHGLVPSFEAEMFTGFVEKPLMNATFKFAHPMWSSTFTGPTEDFQNLTYIISPAYKDARGTQVFIMAHKLSGRAGDFDQVMSVKLASPVSEKWPVGRHWAVEVTFAAPNDYEHRLDPSKLLYHAHHDGSTLPQGEIIIAPIHEYYPGPGKVNGDGKADFEHYCVDETRPKWWGCPG